MELKAKELRIGNIININKEPIVSGISYCVIQDLAQINNGYKSDYLDLLIHEPIPLTEEWLIKLGFFAVMGIGLETNDYIIEIDEYRTFKILARLETKTKKVCYIYVLNDLMQPIIIEYVHQLQNLYFALTLKELTIK